MVCFNQEERVAGLMTDVCPFLKEMRRKVFGSAQIVPQGPYRTQGPVFLNCLSTMVVKAEIVTGDTLLESFLASWFLAMKSEGNKDTFSQWP